MAEERDKPKGDEVKPERGWRDHPVEQEADKDIKEGGLERKPSAGTGS